MTDNPNLPRKPIKSGTKFNRFTVIRFTRILNHRSLYLCKCECGKEKEMIGKTLQDGNTKSCGCLRNERIRKARSPDLEGNQFTRLTVIERVPQPEGIRKRQAH